MDDKELMIELKRLYEFAVDIKDIRLALEILIQTVQIKKITGITVLPE